MKFYVELTAEEEKLVLQALDEMGLQPGEDPDQEEMLVDMAKDKMRHG